MTPEASRTRDVARSAVRADLAQVAFGLFQRQGFDGVTITEVAAAAGVSRNTFLRYFATKEDAVLGAFEVRGEQVADVLRALPAGQSHWAALRRALDTVVEEYREDPDGALAMARLIREAPTLQARLLAQHCGWRPLLTQALAERSETRPSELDLLVRVAAALDCLGIAVDHWAAAGGAFDLGGLLDSAFAALARTD